MKKILIIAPWLADFGHGILITILLLTLFDIEPSVIYFLLGLSFSVIPDLDGLKELFRFGKVGASDQGDHRDGLHYPFAWLLVGGGLIYINAFIGTLFILCVFAHFLNDSWGTGWGIPWLWPLSKRNYKFFSRKDVDADKTFESLVTSWDPQEKNAAIRQYGNGNWLVDTYARLNTISVIEYGTFVTALIVAVVYLNL